MASEAGRLERYYAEGLADGKRQAAQELMDRLAEGGCRDDGWNGGDVVEIVDTWLTGKGISTKVDDNPRYAELIEADAADQGQSICGRCGDWVHTVSSRTWCDGCEAEAGQASLPGYDGRFNSHVNQLGDWCPWSGHAAGEGSACCPALCPDSRFIPWEARS